NNTDNPNPDPYRLFVFVVHWASVNTKKDGIPSPNARKMYVKLSSDITFDNNNAIISIKLFPIKNPRNAASAASNFERAHLATSGVVTVPATNIPITSDIATPNGIGLSVSGEAVHDAMPFDLIAIYSASVTSMNNNGTANTLNFSIDLYPIIAVDIINKPPITARMFSGMLNPNTCSIATRAFEQRNQLVPRTSQAMKN